MAPHDEEHGGGDEGELDGAGEEEGGAVLHEPVEHVAPAPALDHQVGDHQAVGVPDVHQVGVHVVDGHLPPPGVLQLVPGFLHQHLQPDAQVGRDQVHQAQASRELPPVDVHLVVEEDKVHLAEDEEELEGGPEEASEVGGALQHVPQLHPRVDQAPNAKNWGGSRLWPGGSG